MSLLSTLIYPLRWVIGLLYRNRKNDEYLFKLKAEIHQLKSEFDTTFQQLNSTLLNFPKPKSLKELSALVDIQALEIKRTNLAHLIVVYQKSQFRNLSKRYDYLLTEMIRLDRHMVERIEYGQLQTLAKSLQLPYPVDGLPDWIQQLNKEFQKKPYLHPHRLYFLKLLSDYALKANYDCIDMARAGDDLKSQIDSQDNEIRELNQQILSQEETYQHNLREKDFVIMMLEKAHAALLKDKTRWQAEKEQLELGIKSAHQKTAILNDKNKTLLQTVAKLKGRLLEVKDRFQAFLNGHNCVDHLKELLRREANYGIPAAIIHHEPEASIATSPTQSFFTSNP